MPGGWCYEIEAVFEEIGLLHLYVDRERICLKEAKKRLLNKIRENFMKEVVKKPKLRTYIKIKDGYHGEDYLEKYLPRYQRSLMSQIRCGILPLEIECGRFKLYRNSAGKMAHLPPEMRICNLCKLECETELHFVCKMSTV